jgi:hypothetical protein
MAKSSGPLPNLKFSPVIWKIVSENFSLQNNPIDGTATLWRKHCLSANKMSQISENAQENSINGGDAEG